MLDRYGMAVMEERRHDRRRASLENYLRMEYGSTSGMERYLAEAKHAPSPRSGFRTFLAKIAGVASKSPTRAAPAASVKPPLSEEYADHATPRPEADIGLQVRPVGYRRRVNMRPHTALPRLKR